MKKYFVGIIILVIAVLSVKAIDDQQLFIHSKGTTVAVPVDSIDSVAYIASRQQKIFDSKGAVLDAHLVSQIDSMTIGPEVFPVSLTTSKWEISSSVASSCESDWVNKNRIYAQVGSKAGSSYICTTSGGNSTQPVRALNGNNLSVSNLYTNDAINFVVPVTTLKKGSVVDFMLTIYTPSKQSPKYWIFEYEENGEWKSVSEDLKVATEDPNLKYSFYIKSFSSAHHTTFVQSFKTSKTLRNTNLNMRCRVVGKLNNAGETLVADKSAYVGLVNSYYRACYINTYQEIPVKDTLKIAYLGNSFTYYYGVPFMFKEIAQSQGHAITMRSSLKGSQSFGNHMSLELSKAVINESGYDYALLQDVSVNHAYYYSDTTAQVDIMLNSIEIVKQFKKNSPNIQTIIENTWSYAGSAGNYMGYTDHKGFDNALQNGSLLICSRTGSWESPIGIAFEKARAAGITDLYHTDNKHPNRNGSYLSACVNYLLIYGERFDDKVPDCLVNTSVAKSLRKIAEDVVLNNMGSWKNPDASNIVFNPDSPKDSLKLDSIALGENGIKTAAQLMSFASLWNSKGDISSYMNESGEIALLNDIDLTGYTWTPIGDSPAGNTITNGTSTAYGSTTVPFSGVFNGNGHTISGLLLETNSSQVMGLFGIVKGGTVKNVNLAPDCRLSVSRINISNGCAYGFIVGCLNDGKVSDCNVSGLITNCLLNGSGMVCLAGVVGHAFDTKLATIIENCTFNGSINNVASNVLNNSNCAACAGIVGFGRGKSSGKYYTVKNCVNNGAITAAIHRTGGVVGSSTCGMHVVGCTNNGTVTNTLANNSLGNRVGGIIGVDTNTSANYDDLIDGCTNNGTVILGSPRNGEEVIGGLAGIVRRTTVKNCVVNCVVIAPADVKHRGVFVGEVNDNNGVFANNKVSGGLATSIDQDGDYQNYIELTASNYSNYMGQFGSADYNSPSFNTTNIVFGK